LFPSEIYINKKKKKSLPTYLIFFRGITGTTQIFLFGLIRIRKSKDRQHNDQKKKYERVNNNLKNTTKKTKDQATRTSLNTRGELMCSGRVSS
jgi:hypothetical protein